MIRYVLLGSGRFNWSMRSATGRARLQSCQKCFPKNPALAVEDAPALSIRSSEIRMRRRAGGLGLGQSVGGGRRMRNENQLAFHLRHNHCRLRPWIGRLRRCGRTAAAVIAAILAAERKLIRRPAAVTLMYGSAQATGVIGSERRRLRDRNHNSGQ